VSVAAVGEGSLLIYRIVSYRPPKYRFIDLPINPL